MSELKLLVNNLITKGVLTTPAIIQAFEKVDRKNFILSKDQWRAYDDHPLAIGFGQTISQPFTVAFMLELLKLQVGDKVLDVGSGSGWTTALLAEIVGPAGRVWGVEKIPQLVKFGQENLSKYDYPQAEILSSDNELGLKRVAPFDRILVSAAATILPLQLVDQLKESGTMVIPAGDSILSVRKEAEEKVSIQEYQGFSFVPLIQ